MSETKVFTFPSEGTTSGGIMSMLAPLMQKSGIDPGVLALMNNKSGGLAGEGNWFIWVIFLFFLMGWGGNGNGFGFGNRGASTGAVENQINNDYGRELLMQAINGNAQAISALSTNLNCSIGQVQSAISAVQTQVQNVGNQVGMSGMQVINAIQAGNTTIAQQIASCCCENRLAICQQTNTLQQSLNDGVQNLKDHETSGTTAIIAKLDQIQTAALNDKIDSLREKNGTLSTQLNLEHQNQYTAGIVAQAVQPINVALAGLQKEVADIQAKQPSTATVPYAPFVAVPNAIAYNMGLYGTSGSLWG